MSTNKEIKMNIYQIFFHDINENGSEITITYSFGDINKSFKQNFSNNETRVLNYEYITKEETFNFLYPFIMKNEERLAGR
jgi:hypothetical protein